MCCFFTILILLGPRVAAIIWWLFWPAYWKVAFGGNLIWPILGIIFAPWTLLMYVIIFPVIGFWNWLFLILAIIADVGFWAGGGFSNRDRIGL
jgi:hypothetical protein